MPAHRTARTAQRTAPTVHRQRTWWVVGVVGVSVMTAVAIWFGIAATAGRVHWTTTGFEVASDAEVAVRFDLNRDPDRAVTCTLHALDANHFRVGTATVTVPAAPSSPSRHVESVRTVTRAVTGYVDFCAYLRP